MDDPLGELNPQLLFGECTVLIPILMDDPLGAGTKRLDGGKQES